MALSNIIVSETNCDYTKKPLFQKPFSEFIFDQASLYRNNIFLVDGISGRCETFDDVFKKAKILASSIQQLGVKLGECIAISSENRIEYASVMLASVFAGTIFAPINPTYSQGEIEHVLGISKPRVVFCSGFTFKNIAASLKKLSGINYVIVFDNIPSDLTIPMLKFDSLLKNKPIEKPHKSGNKDVLVILTSSGTTGLPKGVMLTCDNMKFFCEGAVATLASNLNENSVVLGLLPLYHGYGYGMLMTSIIVGSKYVLLPKFEEKLFLSTIQKYKITNLFTVPPLMVFLGKHPLVKQFDLSSVQEIVCGAASLGRETLQEVQSRLPHVDIRQGYGMTESSIAVTVTPPNSNKPESVGKLVPGAEAMVIDIETGKSLRRGQVGEILLRGSCVMAGYCSDLKTTRETVDADGWLHTGDIGYVDQEGFFYIVDRIKELIKYKGFQVAPAELEAILLGMSGVRDAAVVGQPDIVAGELPIAYVVLQPNSNLSADAILRFVNGKLSPQKRLREVRFIDAIPRNPSGKILRRILRDSLKAKM